jgi:(R,R)-butanediol dehydrogenase/meso-butanediol dehydrogenase/diacetyl reductase
MLAVRWHNRRDVRLDDVDLELPLDAGMIEAQVRFCGICGSDVGEFAHGPFAIRPGRTHRLSGQEPPVTLGHEFSAVVTAVGPDVDSVAVGDRVAADACWRCGVCAACRSGRYNLCPMSGSIGLCSDGGFAPRVRFPAYAAIALPDAVSDEAGALLEPLAVGLHALDRGGARAGERVVVLGYGPIGATTAAVAAAMGLEVTVSEPHPGRRARAVDAGLAVLAPEGTPREVAKQVRETVGEVRLVVDCSGVPAALEAAPDMTVRGGTVVLVGLPKTPPALDPARQLVLYERTLVASLGYAYDLERVAAMIAAGALDAEALITRRVGLEDVPGELERLADDPGDDLKVLACVRS